MALVIFWYDFVCFAIVTVASFGSLCIIWQKEGCRKSKYRTMYESLLIGQSGSNEFDEGASHAARSGCLSSTQLWTSCWPGVHPVWLLVLRVVSCVIMAGLMVWNIRQNSKTIFIYYTEYVLCFTPSPNNIRWTFTLVIVYFVLATTVSAHGCLIYSKKSLTENEERDDLLVMDLEDSKSTTNITLRAKKKGGKIKLRSHHDQEESEQRAGFWGYVMQITYQTCAGAVVLTDIVFWFLIVPFFSIEHFKVNLLMGCMHSFNAVFLLLDTALNNLPFPWFRITYFMLWSSLYAIFQWVLHACGFPWWPYPFIDLSTPWAPLWYLCLALIHFPCYGLYALVERSKYLIYSKMFPTHGNSM